MAQNKVYRAYIQKRAETFDREGRTMSAQEYLESVNPGREWKRESASRYMRKLRTGERPGTKIEQRAKLPAGAYVVPFADENGRIVDSVTLEVPRGGLSRLDPAFDDMTRNAAEKWMHERAMRSPLRILIASLVRPWTDLNSDPRETTEGLSIAGFRKVSHTSYPTEIIRPV